MEQSSYTDNMVTKTEDVKDFYAGTPEEKFAGSHWVLRIYTSDERSWEFGYFESPENAMSFYSEVHRRWAGSTSGPMFFETISEDGEGDFVTINVLKIVAVEVEHPRPWELTRNHKVILMERLEYLGTDPRLEQGTAYDCTVVRFGKTTDVSVHVAFHARVFKHYRTKAEFDADWADPYRRDISTR